MAKRQQDLRASKKISQYPYSNDVVDMEVNCVLCTAHLYVPFAALGAVLSSLKRVGGAILICHACGQAQLVSGNVPRSVGIND